MGCEIRTPQGLVFRRRLMRFKTRFTCLSPSQILVVGFATVILAGALLLTLPAATRPGLHTNFLEALFTATSAVCVTGLVVVDTYTHWTTFGQLVILLLIQVGGLGFMTMATLFAIIMGRKISFRERLLIQEALNQINVAGVVRLTRYIIFFTLLCESFFAVILGARWSGDLGLKRGLYYGFFHAVSAFNNAGFDLFGNFRSLTAYVGDPVVVFAITSLIILGGIGFSVITDLYLHRNLRHISLHSKMTMTMTAILIFVGTGLILLLEGNNTLQHLSPGSKFLAAYFQSVTPRTAGFNTLDISALHPATQFLLVILMFIGASPGSTGGGIKTTTFFVLVATTWSLISGKEDIQVFKRRLAKDQTIKSITIFITALAVVVTVTFLLSITESGQKNFLSYLFEATSAFGTVGLTMGLTPSLSAAGRVLIILTMFFGRVGPLTVAFALAQRYKRMPIRYPEEKIIVG